MKSWKTYLAEIEDREKSVAPGPWDHGQDKNGYVIVSPLCGIVPINRAEDLGAFTLDFLCHSRTDIPRMAKRIRELEEALKEISSFDTPPIYPEDSFKIKRHQAMAAIANAVLE